MPGRRDPYKFHRDMPTRMTTMKNALSSNLKQPRIGVTQGGSSRQWAGAQVAATDGLVKSRLSDESTPDERERD